MNKCEKTRTLPSKLCSLSKLNAWSNPSHCPSYHTPSNPCRLTPNGTLRANANNCCEIVVDAAADDYDDDVAVVAEH